MCCPPAPLEGDKEPSGVGAPCRSSGEKEGRGAAPAQTKAERGEASTSPSFSARRALIPPRHQAHVSYFWSHYSTAGGVSFQFSPFVRQPPSSPWSLHLRPHPGASPWLDLPFLAYRPMPYSIVGLAWFTRFGDLAACTKCHFLRSGSHGVWGTFSFLLRREKSK